MVGWAIHWRRGWEEYQGAGEKARTGKDGELIFSLLATFTEIMPLVL